MAYSTDLITHLRAVTDEVAKFGGRVQVNTNTYALEVRARGRTVEMLAQFGTAKDGVIGYSQPLTVEAEFFVGWRPYFNRVWPLSFDKRTFKDYCHANRLLTPRHWMSAQAVTAPVLMKHAKASFSQSITGPYTPQVVKAENRTLGEAEFFEEFIHGDIVKIWYWNDLPVVMEKLPMPTVTGDGRRTLRQLVNRAKFPNAPGDWLTWEAVARYQGHSLDAVVPAGQPVLVEFRYRSVLHPFEFANRNVLKEQSTALMRQLREAGPLFWAAIPESIRQDTLYTVDAIADAQDQLWFLEVNCNPVSHPDTYLPMLESVFGALGARALPQQSAAAASIAAAG